MLILGFKSVGSIVEQKGNKLLVRHLNKDKKKPPNRGLLGIFHALAASKTLLSSQIESYAPVMELYL